MQQIADWLKELGMYQYAQRFAENGISFAALRHLIDQDLKDIGVLLGHRRIMLAAIQELAARAPSAPAPTEPARKDDAERRQLTVMFTHLVGSTALSTKHRVWCCLTSRYKESTLAPVLRYSWRLAKWPRRARRLKGAKI